MSLGVKGAADKGVVCHLSLQGPVIRTPVTSGVAHLEQGAHWPHFNLGWHLWQFFSVSPLGHSNSAKTSQDRMELHDLKTKQNKAKNQTSNKIFSS